MEKAEVLVIGGGPAGATAAFRLAGTGHDVLLVDRAQFPRDKVCGESLSPGGLRRLDALGLSPFTPSPSGNVTARFPVLGMRIYSPANAGFHGRYRRGTHTGAVARRVDLDAALLGAAKRAGVRVREGIEALGVTGSTSTEGEVRARVVGTSNEFRIAARRVIVADGRRSFIARELGFLEASETQSPRFAVRAHCAGIEGLEDFAEMHVGRNGYCGVAPMSTTDANICLVVFGNRIEMAPASMVEGFERMTRAFPLISPRMQSARVTGPVRVVGPLRLRSNRSSAGPFAACGDTTGFLDPFTGEGITHAIASGVACADAVASSISGADGAFRDYERRLIEIRGRKPAAARLLFALITRPALANGTARLLARTPRVADALVQFFGDQV